MLRKSLVAAVVAAALVVAGHVAAAPPAQAKAIEVSASAEHRIRTAVKKYAAIQVAQREPYCYGGTGPSCFDCSGLVVAAYRYAGINLPARGIRTSTQMRRWTTAISLGHIHSGDLLFYSGHVEMVYRSKSGKMVAVSATHTGGPPVNFHPIRRSGLLKVGRVVT
ncbi:MAG TPA: NlpC/P60 family protein [Actinomycetota bacterium]|jgi:cell wall-associated NlpC family hydrolase|nr:NlpC/P60 family protein [Actinomycetota bacterium]